MHFEVKDMSCGHCRAAITEAVAAAGGRATVDLEQKRVQVEGLGEAEAEQAIRAAGFTPEPLGHPA